MPNADKAVDKGPKKSYSAPQLTVYGKVQELTQARGNAGQLDGKISHGVRLKTGVF
jgi:hypothetical protein